MPNCQVQLAKRTFFAGFCTLFGVLKLSISAGEKSNAACDDCNFRVRRWQTHPAALTFQAFYATFFTVCKNSKK